MVLVFLSTHSLISRVGNPPDYPFRIRCSRGKKIGDKFILLRGFISGGQKDLLGVSKRCFPKSRCRQEEITFEEKGSKDPTIRNLYKTKRYDHEERKLKSEKSEKGKKGCE